MNILLLPRPPVAGNELTAAPIQTPCCSSIKRKRRYLPTKPLAGPPAGPSRALYMATTCKSQGCAAGMSLHKRALTCLQPGQGRFVNATQAGQGKFLHQSGGPSFQGVKSLPCAAAKAMAISQDSPPPKIFPRQNKGEPAAKSLTPPRSTGGSPLTSRGRDSPVAAVLSSRRSRDREERWAGVGRRRLGFRQHFQSPRGEESASGARRPVPLGSWRSCLQFRHHYAPAAHSTSKSMGPAKANFI